MTWEQLAVGGGVGTVLIAVARFGYGLCLARMALKYNQPLAVDKLGGYQLEEAALARKPPGTKEGK